MFKKLHHNEWLVLFLTMGIWGIAFSSAVAQDQVIILGYTVPSLCLFTNLFGTECLGCGLTRSVVLAVHGKLLLSVKMHLMGIPILLVLTFLSGKYLKILLNHFRKEESEMKFE